MDASKLPILLVASLFFGTAVWSLKTGRIYGRGLRVITREEHPHLFKARVVGFLIAGSILLLFAFISK